MQTRDINTFSVNQTVSILDIPDYQNVLITRISDSGVTVTGKLCGKEVIVSGRSPAFLSETSNFKLNPMNNNNNNNSSINSSSSSDVSSPDNKPTFIGEVSKENNKVRQSYKGKMDNISLPSEVFTIKSLAEHNNIPIPYALKWAKDNCKEMGLAAKPAGQRGRSSVLYSKK
jgi:hypothetical protein